MTTRTITGFLGTDLNPDSSELTNPKGGVLLIISAADRAELEAFVRSQLPPDAVPNYPTSHKFINGHGVNAFKFKVRKGAPWARLEILDGMTSERSTRLVPCTPMALLNRKVELVIRPHKYSFVSQASHNYGERITGVSFSALSISETLDG